MHKLKHVLIMAGGTGGHVFPGLTVAKRLKEAGIKVSWLGTQKGLEAKLVPSANIPLYFISIGGLRGKSLKEMVLMPYRLVMAIWAAMKIIRDIKPDVVLGMGGFASGPGGIASWLLKCPLVIHEQNAKAGMTNQWLARVAKRVLEGFPNTFPQRHNVVVTGNPVRDEIATLLAPDKRLVARQQPLRLLVVGGSLGAVAINQILPKAISELPQVLRPLVYHQTGEKSYEETVAAYREANITAEVVPFINIMDKAYGWSDIVLCRAGALTIAELCACGVGAILIPYPSAVDDHQTTNAAFMVKEGAALLIQQSDLTAEKLADTLLEFIQSPEKCFKMARAAYALRTIDAADKVLAICEEVCQ